MDLAASIQAVTEEVVLRLTRSIAADTGSSNLCLAGGVALNCVANGKVLRDGAFEDIWIQPAAGDAGGALGRRACRLPSAQGAAASAARRRPRSDAGLLSRTGIRAGGHRTALDGGRGEVRSAFRRPDRRPRRRGRWRRKRRSAGSRAAWSSAPARSAALDPRRRAVADDAVGAEPQGQVPRVVPAVRALGAARARGRLLRA